MAKARKLQPTEAELGILRVLWGRGPSTVREVHEALDGDARRWYTTTLKQLQVMAALPVVDLLATEPPGANRLDKAGFAPLHRAAGGGNVAGVIELPEHVSTVLRWLPADLPEWKYVDPGAEVWLLRHLPDQNAQIRRLLPDAKRRLRGLVWMVRSEETETFRVTYLPMPDQQVQDVARDPWISHGEKEIPEELAAVLEFTTAPEGAVTLTIPAAIPTPAEIEGQRQLAEKLERFDARFRLFAFFLFYLGASQGTWH